MAMLPRHERPWNLDRNELELLRILHREEGLSRGALADRLGLSSATISVAVNRLVRRGMLEESGTRSEGVGRPAAILQLRPDAWSVLVYELAPGEVVVGRVSATGSVLQARRHPLSPQVASDGGTLVALMARLGRELTEDAAGRAALRESDRGGVAGPLIGAAVSVSGVVHSGTIVHSAGLRLRDVPLAEPLGDALGLPVWVVNDMDARALAEFRYGAARQRHHVLMVAIEPQGIGAGLIEHGEPYQGSQGSALELGHMTVERLGLACPCGKSGCLEVYAGEHAILTRARAIQQRQDGSAAGSLGTGSVADEVEVLWKLAATDRDLHRVFEDALHYFGIALSNLVTLLDPELVVVGGHLMRVLHPWGIERLVTFVRSNVFQPGKERGRIIPSTLGSDAGLAGASFFAVDQWLRAQKRSRV